MVAKTAKKGNNRPDKHNYYLNITKDISDRSTCLRRHYAALIVKEDTLVSSGYNGSPRGMDNCIDIGFCLREDLGIEPGTHYELCRSVHAEMNAIDNAARSGIKVLGATMYVYGVEPDGSLSESAPCKLCSRTILNAGIEEIIRPDQNGELIIETQEDLISRLNKMENELNGKYKKILEK